MNRYSPILTSLLLLTSCSERFLELTPNTQVSTETFYKTASEFRTAVNAAYSALQADGLYASVYSHLAEVPSDNVGILQVGNAQSDFDVFVVSPANGSLLSFYGASYAGIQRCNVVLNRIDPVTISPTTLKDQFIGEAKFLRALHYFNLVRCFGDVPLILAETTNIQENYEYGRTPVADVYKQIIADLTEAEAKLPVAYTASDIGRATRGAAKALLGKVYLTQKAYPLAVTKLKEVIDLTNAGSRVYELAPQYRDNFDPAKSNNVGHRESIFEVQFKTGGLGEGSPYGNTTPPFGAPATVTGVGNGNGTFMWPTTDIKLAYRNNDLRKTANLDSVRITGVFQTYCKKYLHSAYGTVPFNSFDSDINFPLMRFADVLLMYAEAINEANNGPNAVAYEALNRVRRRAFGVTNATVDYPANLSKTDFFLAVEAERRFELAFEGHRWFDLLRTDRAIPVMTAKGSPIKPHHLLFPIPQAEIDINPSKMKQNPGY
jgi:starch-binding outer membrane protein, SusD/RagB family